MSVVLDVEAALSPAFSLVVDARFDARRLAFVGASGAGKSSTLLLLAGLLVPNRGTVRGYGEVWSDSTTGAFVPPERRAIAYVPQDGGLFPHLSVAQNVAFAMDAPDRRAASAAQRVHELLDRVGLSRLARTDVSPHTLSGGEIARVAIARAMARRSRLVLLDEPFAALDADTRAAMITAVDGWLRETGAQTIFVTHDRDDCARLEATEVTFSGGRVTSVGGG